MAKAFRASLKAILENRRSAVLLNVALGIALIAAVLYLPPLSVYARLSPAGYTAIGNVGGSFVDSDGAQFTVAPAAGDTEAKLAVLPRVDFLEGKVAGSYQAAATNIPGHLTIKSPVYDLSFRSPAGLPDSPGSGVDLVTLTVPVPNDSEPVSALALYEWTGSNWRFLPSHLIAEDDVLEARVDHLPGPVAAFLQASVSPEIAADLEDGASIEAMAGAVTELNPTGTYLQSDGSLSGELPAEVDSVPAGTRVAPVIANWGPDGVVRSDWTDNMLALEAVRGAHIQAIVDFVGSNEFTGVELEYRDVNPELRDQFTGFVTELANRLHAAGKSLGIRVPQAVQVADDTWSTGAYDWRGIGRAADRVVFPAMADLDAYTENGKLTALMQWAAGEVERYRLFVALPALSRERVQSWVLYRPYDEILYSFGNIEVAGGGEVSPSQALSVRLSGISDWSGVQYDAAIHTHWFSYTDAGGTEHTVQLEDPRSLAYKLSLIGAARMRGVVITGSGQHPDSWAVLADYRDLQISEPEEPVSLALSVLSLSGEGEKQELQAGDATWDVTAPVAAGRYILNAAMSIGDYVAVATQATAVEVVAPTPTPTRTPTPTVAPTVEPTATAEEVAVEPTATEEADTESEGTDATPEPTAAATATPAAVVVAPPPSGGGGFGYGVQAHMLDNGQAGQVMSMVNGMGFNWVKQQIEWFRFEPSKGNYQWGGIDEIVNAANAAGVNVMLSVVKAPGWARASGSDMSVAGPPANPQDYADFIGAMAAHFNGRVKAYEIWNEQNLWYEWGGQTIDPAAYMSLLKVGYAAVKANDPNALVISGALTPTGAQPPIGMDDFAYLEGMYQNGLKNYCDGVGAHPSGFNMPPDADYLSFSDPTAIFRGPSDNHHHSWSFRGTMEGYRNIAVTYGDSNKRIWATEFGWASSPTPVTNYEYAADNTLDEQAAWTVLAYQMGRNWGWAGPMFLWNLNFKVVAGGSEQAQWGIVDSGWAPLPVYNALAAMSK